MLSNWVDNVNLEISLSLLSVMKFHILILSTSNRSSLVRCSIGGVLSKENLPLGVLSGHFSSSTRSDLGFDSTIWNLRKLSKNLPLEALLSNLMFRMFPSHNGFLSSNHFYADYPHSQILENFSKNELKVIQTVSLKKLP